MGDLTPSGNPVGFVVTASPAQVPQHITLPGKRVNLTPLEPQHAAQLYPQIGLPAQAVLWDYLLVGPFADEASFNARFEEMLTTQPPGPVYYTLTAPGTGTALGFIALVDYDVVNNSVELGHVIFAPQIHKTAIGTEAIYLVARYVFDVLGYRRLTWKTNDFNAASKHTATRLGFRFEGLFRQHMIVKGHNRDTAWFSMLDKEWPAVKRGFELWLDESNFDADGKQKKTLEDLRLDVLTALYWEK